MLQSRELLKQYILLRILDCSDCSVVLSDYLVVNANIKPVRPNTQAPQIMQCNRENANYQVPKLRPNVQPMPFVGVYQSFKAT